MTISHSFLLRKWVFDVTAESQMFLTLRGNRRVCISQVHMKCNHEWAAWMNPGSRWTFFYVVGSGRLYFHKLNRKSGQPQADNIDLEGDREIAILKYSASIKRPMWGSNERNGQSCLAAVVEHHVLVASNDFIRTLNWEHPTQTYQMHYTFKCVLQMPKWICAHAWTVVA